MTELCLRNVISSFYVLSLKKYISLDENKMILKRQQRSIKRKNLTFLVAYDKNSYLGHDEYLFNVMLYAADTKTNFRLPAICTLGEWL